MSTEITTYSATEVVLSDLRERFGGVAWDVSTPQQMADAKAARKEIRGWRVDLEAERVKKKRTLAARGKEVDTEAERITAELRALETPVAEAIQEVEQAKKQAEAEAARLEDERVARCRDEIDKIRNIPVGLVGEDSETIQLRLDDLADLDLSGLGEFEGVAASARNGVASKLAVMCVNAQAQEEEQASLAEERAEIEKLRAEQEERDHQAALQRDVEDRARAKARAEAEDQREAEDRARRAKLEADEKAARERIAEEEREARAVREKADTFARELRAEQEEDARKEREAEEARLRAERDRIEGERRGAEGRKRAKQEAEAEEERVHQRARDQLLDGREMLRVFVERFGEVGEFHDVLAEIVMYLEASEVGAA